MAMRGNLLPAKKMVLALTSTHLLEVPAGLRRDRGLWRDGPGAQARRRPRAHHRLQLRHQSPARPRPQPSPVAQRARRASDRRGDRRRAHRAPHSPTGEPFFSWPPVHETLEKTMAEVLRCTKAGITINTFALDIERSQFPFVEQIARVNGGRLFYTDVERSGNVRPRRLRHPPPRRLVATNLLHQVVSHIPFAFCARFP